MKHYQFTRKATIIEFGVLAAENEDDARRKIENDEYDDIMDTYGTDEPKEILTIEYDGECEDE